MVLASARGFEYTGRPTFGGNKPASHLQPRPPPGSKPAYHNPTWRGGQSRHGIKPFVTPETSPEVVEHWAEIDRQVNEAFIDRENSVGQGKMPTVKQAKAIAIRTAGVSVVDKVAYSKDWSGKTALWDAGNIAVAEYVTGNMVEDLVKRTGMMSNMDHARVRQLSRVLACVAQDMALQRFVSGSRSRTFVQELVSFGAADLGEGFVSGMM